jgi:hypothetical protein
MNYEYFDVVRELVGIDNIVGGNIYGPLKKIEFVNGFSDFPTEEEIQAKIQELQAAEPLRLLRIQRNQLLAQTDWRMTTDYPYNDQAAWASYRTALRDLPSTANPTLDEQGNLIVDWPTAPSEV